MFYRAAYYEQCLANCGCSIKLSYQQPGNGDENKIKSLKCNMICYSPPQSKLVKTTAGIYFFRLPNKHIPPGQKLRKVFSENFLKLSYSCI